MLSIFQAAAIAARWHAEEAYSRLIGSDAESDLAAQSLFYAAMNRAKVADNAAYAQQCDCCRDTFSSADH